MGPAELAVTMKDPAAEHAVGVGRIGVECTGHNRQAGVLARRSCNTLEVRSKYCASRSPAGGMCAGAALQFPPQRPLARGLLLDDC